MSQIFFAMGKPISGKFVNNNGSAQLNIQPISRNFEGIKSLQHFDIYAYISTEFFLTKFYMEKVLLKE